MPNTHLIFLPKRPYTTTQPKPPSNCKVTINKNDTGFNLNSGISAFEAKDFTSALRLLSPLADEGIAEAQYRMGMMFQNGLGRVKNEVEGFRWMRAAADQGHAYAQHGLGVMYLYGEGPEKDEAKAVECFRAAADQGLPGAQMALGMMYENGQGVEKNEVEARRWYKLAEENTG